MNKKTLKVTEVFYSLQGEGNASGYPLFLSALRGVICVVGIVIQGIALILVKKKLYRPF